MKKQKIIPSLFIMGLMMAVSPSPFSVSASSGYGGGSGTQSDPYLISTPEHLNQLQLDVNVNGVDTKGKYYRLTNNIDLSGYDNDDDESNGNFKPIGFYNSYSDSITFKGTFDGNGKMISNLKIILPEQGYVGLFGYFGYGNYGTIKNVGLENAIIEGKRYVGGLVGYQYEGKVNESYATGSVSGGSYVGGLVGYQKGGTISESYSMGDVSGTDNYVGGLIGYQSGSYSVVSESYAMGSVSGGGSVGGLVGYQNYGTVNQSYWDVETTGQNSSYGGYPVRTEGMTTGLVYRILDGFDFENTWILCEGESPKLRWQVDNCQEVESMEILLGGDGTEESPYLISLLEDLNYMREMVNVGGGFPYRYFKLMNDIDFSDYDMDRDVSNGNLLPIGGLEIPFKGKFDGNGFVISNVEIILPEQDYVGLFGYADSAAIQDLGLENILIEGKEYAGGLVGCQSKGSINQSYVTGSVDGSQYIGGLVGYQSDGGAIEGSYATGKVNGSRNSVGGLVGYQSGSSSVVSESYAMGEVSGFYYVGGLVGQQSSGTIQQSYAMGEVDGNSYAGGLVGDSKGTIAQNYAIGDVVGSQHVGGLIGGQSGGTIQQSYAMGEVNGRSNVGGLVGYHYKGTVTQSYSTGNVVGSGSGVGGLVGYKQSSSSIIEDSYWDVETSGRSGSDAGIGLTTKQMTKRKVKENMIGFDFDTVWQESNGYPLLHWQTPDPISGEEDVTINGNIEATILSLTIPSNSMSFVLNPNEEVGKQFVASDFELINGSQTPLMLEIKSFEQVTDVLNDVESTKYSDWTGLNKTQSKDIALALVPKTGEGWLTLNEGNRWVANLGETSVGTIKGNSTVSFGFEAKHGSSFTETLMPQYQLTFIFGLQD